MDRIPQATPITEDRYSEIKDLLKYVGNFLDAYEELQIKAYSLLRGWEVKDSYINYHLDLYLGCIRPYIHAEIADKLIGIYTELGVRYNYQADLQYIYDSLSVILGSNYYDYYDDYLLQPFIEDTTNETPNP